MRHARRGDKLLRGIEPHLNPQTDSSGVVGVDPPHLYRCDATSGALAGGARVVPLLEGLEYCTRGLGSQILRGAR
jgi:hypothetical protein